MWVVFQPKRCPGPLVRHESGRGPVDAPVVRPVEPPAAAGRLVPTFAPNPLTVLTTVVRNFGVGRRLLPVPPNWGQILVKKS